MTKERLAQIKHRISSALDSDLFKEDSEEGRDIRMMEEMFNYISLLNIEPVIYENFLQSLERGMAGAGFVEHIMENGDGIY